MKDVVINQLLQDPFAKETLRECGIEENSSPATKIMVLDKIGEILMKRLTLEILKKLPEKEHKKFDKLLFAGKSTDVWYDFLSPYVGDVDMFVQKVTSGQMDSIKQELAAV